MLLLIVIIVWNVALASAVGWLLIVLRERTSTVARVLDIHTEMLRRVRGEMAALQPKDGVKYGDAVISLPTDLQMPDSDTVTEAVARHRNAAVREALPVPDANPHFRHVHISAHRCAGIDHCNDAECEHDEWEDTGSGPGFPTFTQSAPPK